MKSTTLFTIAAMSTAMMLAGCTSHHVSKHFAPPIVQHQPASFKAFMKANEAANTSNMMKITPIKLPNRD